MSTEPNLVDIFVIGGGINGAGIARDAAWARPAPWCLARRTTWR